MAAAITMLPVTLTEVFSRWSYHTQLHYALRLVFAVEVDFKLPLVLVQNW
jgi:hypothetical protein